jgi:hypothetical protein
MMLENKTAFTPADELGGEGSAGGMRNHRGCCGHAKIKKDCVRFYCASIVQAQVHALEANGGFIALLGIY